MTLPPNHMFDAEDFAQKEFRRVMRYDEYQRTGILDEVALATSAETEGSAEEEDTPDEERVTGSEADLFGRPEDAVPPALPESLQP